MEEGQCRYCGETIAWVKTERGKNLPIDPDPIPVERREAKFMLDEDDGTVVFVPKAERVGTLHATHFDTCQDPREVDRREKEWEEYKRNNPLPARR